MEYLAVAQMPPRGSRRIRGTLLGRGYRLPWAWHAVAAETPANVALCGFRSNREPSRAWVQTVLPRRCHQCQRLIEEAEPNPEVPSNASLWTISRELAPEGTRPGVIRTT